MPAANWIVPAAAESVAVTIIRDGLAELGVPAVVATRYPKTDQTTVRVTVTGGTTPNLVTDAPTILVECWSATEVEAEQLANSTFACLTRCPGSVYAGSWVRGWDPGSRPQNYPDPDTHMSRYQFTGVLNIRPSIS